MARAAATLVWVLATGQRAAAHLVPFASSMTQELARTTTLVLARSTARSADEPMTLADPDLNPAVVSSFDLLAVLAGENPGKRFRVWSPRPAARFESDQVAFLWMNPLPEKGLGEFRLGYTAGGRVEISSQAAADQPGLAVGQAWLAMHGTGDSGRLAGPDLVQVLVDLASSGPESLALRAIFELGSLVHHPEWFGAGVRSQLGEAGRRAAPGQPLQAAFATLLDTLPEPAPAPSARAGLHMEGE